MGMEINGVSSGCAAPADSQPATGKPGGITTTTVNFKTDRPGVTRKAEIKTGFTDKNDYIKYLQEKYPYMNSGANKIQGVECMMTVSPEFLRKCMNDPEKAKHLEENLAAIPGCVDCGINYCKERGAVVNYIHYEMDADGNMCSEMCSTYYSEDGGALENVRKMAEKAAKKRAEKKEEQEKAAEKKEKARAAEETEAAKPGEAEKSRKAVEITVSFTGTGAQSVTEQILEKWQAARENPDAARMTGIDINA